MKTPAHSSDLWAGSEASLLQFLQIQSSMFEHMQAGSTLDQPKADAGSTLLNVSDGIGVVSIKGSLTNRDSPWNAMFGVVSYGAIREAMIEAATNDEVKHIVLDIASGGGGIYGMSDTGALIRMVNDRVKPVTAFTDANMASAAYWLGAAAGKVYATSMSTVGSVGVIATHAEYSQQLKDEGVGVTVMRAGKYKALANGVEPLTDVAKAQMQEQLQAAYQLFVDHVAGMRGQSSAFVDANMAQGREFFGAAALAAGLVDGITTYDAMMSDIKASIDSKATQQTYLPRNQTQGVQGMKKALTEQGIAALAEGAVASTGAAAITASTEADVAAALAATEAAAALAATEAAAALAATEAAAAAAGTAATAATGGAEIVAFLQAQVADKDKLLLDANMLIKTLESKATEQSAAHASLMEIAAKSVSNMRVACGGSAFDTKDMTATALLAEHQRVTGEFQSKFKAGGVAAVAAADASKGEAGGIDHMHFARLAAAGSTAKHN